MAANRFSLGGQIIPFWKRKIEKLPLWQKGDPQIRILMPTFWMKLIPRPDDAPRNRVYFETHPQMTKMDIKNYLERVYKVPVAHVRTQIKLTENVSPAVKSSLVKRLFVDSKYDTDPIRDKPKVTTRYSEEYKQAVVVLGQGETFHYPDVVSKIRKSMEALEDPKLLDKINPAVNKKGKIADPTQNLAGWFRRI